VEKPHFDGVWRGVLRISPSQLPFWRALYTLMVSFGQAAKLIIVAGMGSACGGMSKP
jgi:hypothetical protein